LRALFPGKLNRSLVGLGKANRSFDAYVGGGREQLIAHGRGFEAKSIDSLLEDVKAGRIAPEGKGLAYIPNFGKPFKAKGVPISMEGGVLRFGKNVTGHTSPEALTAHLANAGGDRVLQTHGLNIDESFAQKYEGLTADERMRMPDQMLGRATQALNVQPANKLFPGPA
jgi:hypothetical protein